MLACGHTDSASFGVCGHVRAGESFTERFTGKGIECDLVCAACQLIEEIERVCAACHDRVRAVESSNDGFIGTPGIVDEPSALRFDPLPSRTPRVDALIDVQPRRGDDRDLWIGLTAGHDLVELDLDRDEVTILARVEPALFRIANRPNLDADHVGAPAKLALHVSRDGRLAGVTQEDHGVAAVVIDLETGATLMSLVRDDYYPQHSVHSFAFVEHGGRTLVVHAGDWNRLDVHDPRTGALLTARGPTRADFGQERPEHYLDYFHAGLAVSPDQGRIVDNGWVWQPDGMIVAWQIEPWLAANPWESEDGASRRMLCWRNVWDCPLVWLDGTRVAIWGYGQDQTLIDGVRIFDTDTGHPLAWFAGPRGELVFDRVLFALGEHDTTVWSVERGTRLHHEPCVFTRYHPTAKTFLRIDGATLQRARLVGLDARLATGVVVELAERIARERAFEDLPVLGDALEAAGCTDGELLAHCQSPGPHGDRCWALDRLTR